ncbi:ATP-binding cassette domain-containing protein [Aeromonas sp. 30P]|uniref:ATP-binding cassette domain-containing protein n=1 Tax=Aeromonas sp. 30P TaxID=3452717 RepID=UPI0038D2AE94
MLSHAVISYCKKNNIRFHPEIKLSDDESILYDLNVFFNDELFRYSLVDITHSLSDINESITTCIVEQHDGNYSCVDLCNGDKYIENYKKVFLIQRDAKQKSSGELKFILNNMMPKTNAILIAMVLFGLLTPLYSNLFNSRLVYSDSISSLLYITFFFIFFVIVELFLKHVIYLNTSRQRSIKTVILEEYMLSFFKNSYAKNISIKVRTIINSTNALWENYPLLWVDIAFVIIFSSCVFFMLGIYSIILFIYYVIIFAVFARIRFSAYKKMLETSVASNDSLARCLVIEKEKQQLHFIRESNILKYYKGKILIDEENKKGAALNNHVWGELLRSNSFVSMVVMYISCYYAIASSSLHISSVIAVMIINSRLSSSLSACVNKYFLITLNKYHLNLSAIELMDKAALRVDDGVLINHCDKLEISDLSLSIDNNQLIDKYSGEFVPGDVVAVVGPSGSGKSTLLKAITKMIPTNYGEIKINNVSIMEVSNRFFNESVAFHASEIGFFRGTLKENFNIYGIHSINEMISIISKCIPTLNITHDILNVMEANEIGMSNGEKQKLLLLMVTYKKPSLIILDESTSFLSSADSYSFLKEVINNNPRAIIFFAFHSNVLSPLCNKTISLSKGRQFKNIIKIKS